MLADGQDPTALEARLAFHLHRLKLTGAPLRRALQDKASITTALTQARLGVSREFITDLALTLNIHVDDLMRDLTEQETQNWHFYRISARHRDAVWRAASQYLSASDIPHTLAAAALGMGRQKLVDTLAGRRKRILDRNMLQNLFAIRGPGRDPELWISDIAAREGGGDPSNFHA